jgi:hypothetical protein
MLTLSRALLGCSVVALLQGALLTNATALDIRGTWKGTAVCKGIYDGDNENATTYPAIIEISQDVNDLSLTMSLEDRHEYRGVLVITTPQSKSGHLTFLQCQSKTNAFSWVGGYAKAKVDLRKKFTELKGTLIVGNADTAFTCKLETSRTDSRDPKVRECQ